MQIRSSKVLAEFITSAFPNVVQLELNPDEGGELSSLQALEDAQTDWFICMGLLERLEDDGKVISELSRILRPGGFGIVLAPVSLSLAETDQEQGLPPEERWRRFGGGDRLRLYAKQDYMDKLAESGFRVSQYGEAYFGRDVFVAMGITPSSTLYVVEK